MQKCETVRHIGSNKRSKWKTKVCGSERDLERKIESMRTIRREGGREIERGGEIQ